ncbi:cytochrome P450 [Streptomyces violaceorubidus]|uniref:cytochrome P450 n=1 Tax=Streptomyces violaceorubidus TaxID=284042 RepID=UPI0004BE7322|nr:cytochrome P450 [Streptomyces violaceorubidus]
MPQTVIDDFPFERAAGCPFDPPPRLAALRSHAPLVPVRIWDGGTPWLVTRYEDQRAVLSDPRFSADSSRPGLPAPTEGFAAQGRQEVRALSMQDGPEHARQRRMLIGHFTVRRINAMTPRLVRIIDGLLDRMEAAGPATDLVKAFALPLPSLVIGELLGVPEQDQALFQRVSATMISRDSTARKFTEACAELGDYLGELIRRKDADPGDDLLSSLVVTRMRSGELTPELLVETAITLLVAGHETTTNQLALGTLVLLRNPDQLAVVRDSDDPARVASAVEELLRYLSITQTGLARVATEDVEIGGRLVRAGEGVIVPNASGNRDAAVFDDPDRFDIGRPHVRGHLAFGHGPHQCLGQALARLELQLAHPALLRRFPALRTTVPNEDIAFKHDMIAYGVHELPVTW